MPPAHPLRPEQPRDGHPGRSTARWPRAQAPGTRRSKDDAPSEHPAFPPVRRIRASWGRRSGGCSSCAGGTGVSRPWPAETSALSLPESEPAREWAGSWCTVEVPCEASIRSTRERRGLRRSPDEPAPRSTWHREAAPSTRPGTRASAASTPPRTTRARPLRGAPGTALRNRPCGAHGLSAKAGRPLRPAQEAGTTSPTASPCPPPTVASPPACAAASARAGNPSGTTASASSASTTRTTTPRRPYPEPERLRTRGVIGAIGAGTNRTGMPNRFARDTDDDVVLCAGRSALLDQSAHAELMPEAAARGKCVVIGGVFDSGLLAEPRPGAAFDCAAAPRQGLDRALRLQALAACHGVLPRASPRPPGPGRSHRRVRRKRPHRPVQAVSFGPSERLGQRARFTVRGPRPEVPGGRARPRRRRCRRDGLPSGRR